MIRFHLSGTSLGRRPQLWISSFQAFSLIFKLTNDMLTVVNDVHNNPRFVSFIQNSFICTTFKQLSL